MTGVQREWRKEEVANEENETAQKLDRLSDSNRRPRTSRAVEGCLKKQWFDAQTL